MKKGLILSGLCLILLSGCGSKTMVCSREETEDGVTAKMEFKIKYNPKDDTVQRLDGVVSMKSKTDEYEDEISDMADDIEDSFDELKGEKYFSSKVKSNKKSLSADFTLRFDKMDEDDIEDLGSGLGSTAEDGKIDVEVLEEAFEDGLGLKCRKK